MRPCTLLPACLLLAGAPLPAQNSTHAGCVQPWADAPNTLLMTEGNSCSVLTGKLAGPRLKGHSVTLTGTVIAATSAEPQSIAVQTVANIGETCSETCTPEPPGHRGLTKRPKPGAQGITPGEHNPSAPPANP